MRNMFIFIAIFFFGLSLNVNAECRGGGALSCVYHAPLTCPMFFNRPKDCALNAYECNFFGCNCDRCWPASESLGESSLTKEGVSTNDNKDGNSSKIFDTVDKNQNGFISKVEFFAYIESSFNGNRIKAESTDNLKKDRMEAIFVKIDINQDSFISRKEAGCERR